MISTEGHKLNYALRFAFKTTNNVTEYEAFLPSLLPAKETRVHRIEAKSDSQLVVTRLTKSSLKSDISISLNYRKYQEKKMDIMMLYPS